MIISLTFSIVGLVQVVGQPNLLSPITSSVSSWNHLTTQNLCYIHWFLTPQTCCNIK
jgi:hypothetical protein